VQNRINNCRSCGSSILVPIFDLGNQPWCNDFLSQDRVGKEPFYPLHLHYCVECCLAQLDYTVPKEVMFSEHTYVSGTTLTLKKHFFDIAEENKIQFNLTENDLILDIGGNDGTQLLQYQKLGFRNLVNVESASNIAKISSDAGIKTYNSFFNEEFVIDFLKASDQAKLISASGVFFHLEEIHSVLRGIKKLLAPDGIFVVQFMYLKDVIDNLTFDAIYHEHLVYYTLESLQNLIRPHELEIFDAHRSPIHGGSVVVRICHAKSNFLNHPRTRTFEELEKTDHVGLNDLLSFAKKIRERKELLGYVLGRLAESGKVVYGYGAPAKGNTLLNFFGINSTLIKKIVEVNPLKFGLYTPGTHIPVVQESAEDLPDYYLVLAWNFLDEIIAKNNKIRQMGVKFITPFPEIKVY
jgi:hypothetical protein